MNTQTEQLTKTNVFDEHGQTVEHEVAVDETTETETVETDVAAEDTPKPTPKYRIGDREFATQDEALAFAQSQVAESQVTDAYRQGMRDALATAQPAAENVTSAKGPADDLDTEELYTNPQEFLNKFATKIKTETQAELDHKENIRSQSDQIWREFVERHPMLADFRTEVENFATQHQGDVRAIIATKGRPAGYDFVATKIKSRFESYANAVKPKRELPNSTAGASPGARASNVTPKAESKKALSFAEQVRSLKKRG